METDKRNGQESENDSYPSIYSIRRAAFLDILGFKNLIDRSVSDKNLLQKLNTLLHSNLGQESLLDFCNLIPTPDIRPISERDYRVSSFSDSILVSAPYSEHDVYFLLYLCHFSCMYFEQGFMVRGAVLANKLLHQDDLVFGPALQRAYKIESDRAKYPRIILDPGPNNYESECCILNNEWQRPDEIVSFELVRTDPEDGELYLNIVGYALARASLERAANRYLKQSGECDSRSDKCFWQRWPKRVRNAVVKNCYALPKGSEVRKKYEWYAKYFNDAYFVNKIDAKNRPYSAVSLNQGLGKQFGKPIELDA